MKRVHGPKDGPNLEALFNSKERGQYSASDLKKTKALILLSILGNEFCTGEYLQAIAEGACSLFNEVTFLIADEVYWNNLKNTADPSTTESDELKQQASALGDKFITDNIRFFLSLLNCNQTEMDAQFFNLGVDEQILFINSTTKKNDFKFTIMRWRDWVNHPVYQGIQQDIEAEYQTNPVLLKSVEEAASDFARRHRSSRDDEALWLMRSRSYLRQESPAICWLAAQLHYQFICYPGSIIKPFIATQTVFMPQESVSSGSRFVITEPDSRVCWIDLYFRRYHTKQDNTKQDNTKQDNSLSMHHFFNNPVGSSSSGSSSVSSVSSSPVETLIYNYGTEIKGRDIPESQKITELVSRLIDLQQILAHQDDHVSRSSTFSI